ncbi:MAG: type II CRISPR-associated endonuclease Cas1 [Prevotella sp.]|jgi:CRISPR-associated protein Cas1
MLKRSLVFTSPAVLSLKNEQVVISVKEMPTEKVTVPIEDVGFVMIDNQQVSVTIPLLNKLTANNVTVVICNSKGMPTSLLTNLDSNNLQGEILQNQMDMTEPMKKNLWKQIVEKKIKNQALLLSKLGMSSDKLKSYSHHIKSGDADNREGLAARVYFHELFGGDFIRDRNIPGVNALLNYGYTVLRAATARAIVTSGLFPGIGVFHHNRSNAFPLADDLMEPYRPFVDEIVYRLFVNQEFQLNKGIKQSLINVLYCDTQFPKAKRPLEVALSMTTASLVKCISKEVKTLNLPSLP